MTGMRGSSGRAITRSLARSVTLRTPPCPGLGRARVSDESLQRYIKPFSICKPYVVQFINYSSYPAHPEREQPGYETFPLQQ